MSINDYLAEIESFISTSPIVASYSLNIDRKTEEIVFVSGRLDFETNLSEVLTEVENIIIKRF